MVSPEPAPIRYVQKVRGNPPDRKQKTKLDTVKPHREAFPRESFPDGLPEPAGLREAFSFSAILDERELRAQTRARIIMRLSTLTYDYLQPEFLLSTPNTSNGP